jgi:hypothetical protein
MSLALLLFHRRETMTIDHSWSVFGNSERSERLRYKLARRTREGTACEKRSKVSKKGRIQ